MEEWSVFQARRSFGSLCGIVPLSSSNAQRRFVTVPDGGWLSRVLVASIHLSKPRLHLAGFARGPRALCGIVQYIERQPMATVRDRLDHREFCGAVCVQRDLGVQTAHGRIYYSSLYSSNLDRSGRDLPSCVSGWTKGVYTQEKTSTGSMGRSVSLGCIWTGRARSNAAASRVPVARNDKVAAERFSSLRSAAEQTAAGSGDPQSICHGSSLRRHYVGPPFSDEDWRVIVDDYARQDGYTPIQQDGYSYVVHCRENPGGYTIAAFPSRRRHAAILHRRVGSAWLSDGMGWFELRVPAL